MNIGEYLEHVRAQYASGNATEHSYRPALYVLFQSIDPNLTVINEPKKSEGGMPDFMFQRGEIPFGWAEAKDIDKDVIKLKGYSKEQRKRYEAAYPNLIYTNGVDFEFIREGESVHFVSIADFLMGLQPNPERFGELERQLKLFAEQKPISIRSAARLADMMAAKAAIIKDELEIALAKDHEFRSDLGGQYKSFKANLLPGLEPDEFADLYAETITYGMFAARFHDKDLGTFSRQEAMEDLPASNPFLKGLFRYVAGELPKRLEYVVDDLVQLMRASDPHSLFKDFGKFTARNDPFVHFYEDFLAAYNPAKRRSRGVWYTPEPVVDFLVRAVDDVLKAEFDLGDGLADISQVTVDWDTGRDHPKTGKAITEKREIHKVQILDPATGTGTFLAKATQLISDQVKKSAPGNWSGYVERNLLPRLHGFELLMASYAMCHMKLDMMLDQTDYKPSAHPPRLSVWLTNALEPGEREMRDLFFRPLAEEARGASEVKRQFPIMCVIGNPPYSGESANKGAIDDLMKDYKKEPGGKERLKERNPKWINDDYVKFIRFSENLIDKNPSGGILGFITNHGYIDNPTFRGMRWHLLNTFDKIWIINLHGNYKRKEKAPDGGPDANVFDIQQGVALMIAAKTPNKNSTLAQVWYADVWGTRKIKYDTLFASDLQKLAWTNLDHHPRYFMFYPVDHSLLDQYDAGFPLSTLFIKNEKGITTSRDDLAVAFSSDEMGTRLDEFINPAIDDQLIRNKYWPSRKEKKGRLPGDTGSWSLNGARGALTKDHRASTKPIAYRPFDFRQVIYSDVMLERPRSDLMNHIIDRENLSLATNRGIEEDRPFTDTLVFDQAIQIHSLSIKEANNFAPLYSYPDETVAQTDALASKDRTLNLHPKLYGAICKAAGIDPADQARPDDDFRAATGEARPSEVKVFDYIYGVLHSPAYRETFAEFLKIDFPRIPYPPSPEIFHVISEKGEQLRRLHLMEPAAIGETPYSYEGEGDDIVANGFPKFENEKVHINKNQYFAGVPKSAWEFYIGGYQPAQKWISDRRGRTLSYDDITHYQRVVKVLVTTERIMKEIKLPLDWANSGPPKRP